MCDRFHKEGKVGTIKMVGAARRCEYAVRMFSAWFESRGGGSVLICFLWTMVPTKLVEFATFTIVLNERELTPFPCGEVYGIITTTGDSSVKLITARSNAIGIDNVHLQ